jgi:hypothetical protein
MMITITNLHQIKASIYTALSPNINFCNPSHKVTFKKTFTKTYKQVHLSATSCKIGFQKEYRNRCNLTGGTAIITTDQWASKVCSTQQDPRGHGTYTVSTLQGRNNRKLAIIAAYISVEKGTYAGINTVHAQQNFIMEQHTLQKGKILPPTICPRKEAIKALGEEISKLQEDNHKIILTIDANQKTRHHRNLLLEMA